VSSSKINIFRTCQVRIVKRGKTAGKSRKTEKTPVSVQEMRKTFSGRIRFFKNFYYLSQKDGSKPLFTFFPFSKKAWKTGKN